MSEVITKIVQALVRIAMGPVIAWLISKNIITSDESVKLVIEVTTYAIAGGWAARAWLIAHRTKMTGLAMPRGTTPAQLQAQMDTGNVAPANTPVNMAPQIETKGDK